MPDETTLRRWANLLQPATLHRRLDHGGVLAQSLKVTHGRQRRRDGTVVDTTSPHPPASTWLSDGVRVLSRTLATAKRAVDGATPLARHAFRARPRSATRQLQSLMAAARQRGAPVEARLRTADQRRLTITTTRVKQAEHRGPVRIDQGAPLGRQLATTLPRFVPLVQPVMPQTTRRILQGDAVPAPETGVSLCASPTAILRQGKPGRPPACGRGLWLDEVEGGLIRRDAILEGHAAEEAQVPPSLAHHRRVFHRPPRLLARARGVQTAANER